MINFIQNHDKPKSKDKITIDLTECQSRKDFVIKLSEYLCGENGRPLQSSNLDAFNDVLFDFYAENWLNWKDLVIVGWENFVTHHPIFSQRVLAILQDCFISCIQGHLRFANANHALETDVLPLQNKIPKIYIVVKDI